MELSFQLNDLETSPPPQYSSFQHCLSSLTNQNFTFFLAKHHEPDDLRRAVLDFRRKEVLLDDVTAIVLKVDAGP